MSGAADTVCSVLLQYLLPLYRAAANVRVVDLELPLPFRHCTRRVCVCTSPLSSPIRIADCQQRDAASYLLLLDAAGLPPFYDTNVELMYEKILHAELRFPKHFLPETRSLLSGMLTRQVDRRLGYGGAGES